MTDGAAFPSVVVWHDGDGNEVVAKTPGLTRRELFAAMAMAGEISKEGMSDNYYDAGISDTKWVAKNAIAYADALITELDK